MIVAMAKVRVLGPRDGLEAALRALQDFGRLHVAETVGVEGVRAPPVTARDARRPRQLRRMLDDVDAALAGLGPHAPRAAPPRTAPAAPGELAVWAREARRARRRLDAIARREVALGEERALLLKYRDVLDALRPFIERARADSRLAMHAAVVPAAERAAVERLVAALDGHIDGDADPGRGVLAHVRPLHDGDVALLLVMPTSLAARVERLLSEARLPELALPAVYGARLSDAVPAMVARLAALPAELTALDAERAGTARAHGPSLAAARAAVHDALAAYEARARCAVTRRAFAIAGWLPADQLDALRARLRTAVGPSVVVEQLAREQWGHDEAAPVVLRNPRIFRPFEFVVGMMPLPRYGSIDPTPFVAVFFPMFFGLIVGDVGYGAMLLLLSLLLRRGAAAGSVRRIAADVALPCALFAVAFGVAFGEVFGDLGHRLLGIHPPVLDREHAAVAFLAVSVALGLAHVLLGFVLGALAAWRHERRHALGSGLSALMLVLVVLALLAAFEVLPHALLTPTTIAILVAFPVLVALEGIIAPIELLSAVGNVLSYARLMALGTASVMLAVVANDMAGATGSAALGVTLAMLFHLVNFAIALFSPTIHALRLHYVEFFGKFYSPGGAPYAPFAHWRPEPGSDRPHAT